MMISYREWQATLSPYGKGEAMTNAITRRALLVAGAAAAVPVAAQPTTADEAKLTFRFCLNTSTVRDNGKHRRIEDLIDIAAKAGYGGIEPWIAEIDDYVKRGESLNTLKKRIDDAGLKVPSAIGFAEWILDDDTRRKKGLETAQRDMDWVKAIGGERIAAPPIGATKEPLPDLMAAADRYRALLELGQSIGVTPEVEVWGFSKTLKRLGEAWLIATECGKAGGCILPDVYHLYKGGSEFLGLQHLNGSVIGIFHVNDYPKISRDKIVDADRVYPGDGVAPLVDVVRTLRVIRYDGFLSVELFNKDYWKQDGLSVATTALRKLKAVILAQ
jgi:2-keto-myo-inositol isomerase